MIALLLFVRLYIWNSCREGFESKGRYGLFLKTSLQAARIGASHKTVYFGSSAYYLLCKVNKKDHSGAVA